MEQPAQESIANREVDESSSSSAAAEAAAAEAAVNVQYLWSEPVGTCAQIPVIALASGDSDCTGFESGLWRRWSPAGEPLRFEVCQLRLRVANATAT